MVVGEGLSYSEVAKMMGMGKSTLHNYVKRAKEKIATAASVLPYELHIKVRRIFLREVKWDDAMR